MDLHPGVQPAGRPPRRLAPRLIEALAVLSLPSRAVRSLTAQEALANPFLHWDGSTPCPDADILVHVDAGARRLEVPLPCVLTFNESYLRRVQENPATAAQTDVKERIQRAKWLLHALETRQENLRRIAEYTLGQQEAFFTEGMRGLRPLTRRQASRALGLHPSTVTRAVLRKVVQTPVGEFPFAYFFDRGIGENAHAANTLTVKAVLWELVQQEDYRCPLSDSRLVERLRDLGFDVARRTVAKYRLELGVPSAYGRRGDANRSGRSTGHSDTVGISRHTLTS